MRDIAIGPIFFIRITLSMMNTIDCSYEENVRDERETSLPKITRIVRAQIRKNSRTSVFVTKQLTPQTHE